MNTKIIGISIAAFIGIVVLGSVLMPILDDATATTDTFTNDGYFHMNKYGSSDDSVTLVWDHTTPRAVSVNGTTYNLATPVNQWIDLVVGDDWYIRYAYGGSVSFIGFDGADQTNQVLASVQNGSDMTAVFTGGTVTVTVTTTGADPLVKTTDYIEYYVISGDSGSYVMKKSNESVYMSKETPIYGIGSSDAFSGLAMTKLTGSIEDGVTATVLKSTSGEVTAGPTTVNTTEVSDYTGFYQLSTITFDFIKGEETSAATYSYFIVPSEVAGERAVHFTDGQNAILGAIPIMIIVAILLGVVALVVRSRME